MCLGPQVQRGPILRCPGPQVQLDDSATAVHVMSVLRGRKLFESVLETQLSKHSMIGGSPAHQAAISARGPWDSPASLVVVTLLSIRLARMSRSLTYSIG